MGNLQLTNLGGLLNETGLVLLIGMGAAGLAFAVGWTTMRRRKAPPPPAAGRAPAAAEADPFVAGSAGERRAAVRRGGHAVTVELSDPDEAQPPQRAWVVNRSVGGLCLMVPQAVPIGSVWTARPTDAPPTAAPVLVEVKTCVAAGREWRLNCCFQRTPSYAVLLMFG